MTINPIDQKRIYVNAETGEIHKSKTKTFHNGTATTMFNGSRTIDTKWRGNIYQDWILKANDSDDRDIRTKQGTVSEPWWALYQVDNDNGNWGTNEQKSTSVHWSTVSAWDYFKQKYDYFTDEKIRVRSNSPWQFGATYIPIKNKPGLIITGYLWEDEDEDGTWQGSLDNIAHEFTHSIIQSYVPVDQAEGEIGAIIESISDIFAVLIEASASGDPIDWEIGNDTHHVFEDGGTGTRSLKNPNMFNHRTLPDRDVLGLPDTYEGPNWYTGTVDGGGIHINCGVHNYWFYLLSNGGIHNGISVNGIGVDDAEQILYNTLSTKMKVDFDFKKMAEASIASASEIFGICSQQVEAVTNAWAACGIGNVFDFCVTIEGPSMLCISDLPVEYTAINAPGSNFSWTYPQEWDVVAYGGNGQTLRIKNFNNSIPEFPHFATISVTATNGSTISKGINIVDCYAPYPDEPCFNIQKRSQNNIFKLTLNIFPNPSSNLLNIQYNNASNEEYNLKVIDINGRQKYTYKGTFIESIDITNYENGLYYLIIESKEGVINKSFVKHD